MKIKLYLKRIGLGILTLIILMLSYIYIASSLIRNKTYDTPLVKSIQIPTDSSAIAEGLRQFNLAHCGGCHGDNLAGKVFHEDSQIGSLVAPNLSKRLSQYSNPELYRLIKHGIKKDGKAAFPMPSDMYYHLKEESVAQIIAYLRTLPAQESAPDLPEASSYGFFVHMMLSLKLYDLNQEIIAIQGNSTMVNYDQNNPVSFGKYLTYSTCSHCHGKNLEGNPQMNAPGLVISTMYKKEQFREMLKTGNTITKGMESEMTKISQKHMKYLYDEEIDAIYAFLQTLRPQEATASTQGE